MNIKEQIITICQGELEGKELIQSIESLVSLLTPFNHEAEFEFDACGIDIISVKLSEDLHSTSKMVEELEKGLTKRELAFALWQDHCEVSRLKQMMSMFNSDALEESEYEEDYSIN